jgi:N6-L-threonylcarbamoyladenine synthase|tara:strand:+ start:15978 stop:16979 length:1002 start_codon:yes stop_codon:yes gene_type:complete
MSEEYYLAIETSCDETCSSIINSDGNIISNVVFSQAEIHNKYGGVLPDIASKNHTEKIGVVIEESLQKANIELKEVKKVFVTNGPGLINCLMIGVTAARTISLINQIPVYPINHVEGHIASCFIEHKITFPALCLVVSGGHTSMFMLYNSKEFNLIGNTVDDAAGEAFDKGAKILGLGYPGGILIDKLSKNVKKDFYKFPIAKMGKNSLNFSFSGLKTSLKYYLDKNKDWEKNLNQIAASYQEAIVDSLLENLLKAFKKFNPSSIMITGGVACNSRLRSKAEEAFKNKTKVFIPSIQYCTDNAAMIGKRGFQLENDLNLKGEFEVFSTSKKLV